MWRGIAKRELVVIIVVLVLLCFALAGCAVPVRNESNDKPLLTAPTGVSVPQADGSTAHNPALPQPKAENYQHAPAFNWMLLLQTVFGLVLGTGAVVKIRTLGAAVRDAASYGDDMERAETDADVVRAKTRAATRQASNGTFTTIDRIRSKT